MRYLRKRKVSTESMTQRSIKIPRLPQRSAVRRSVFTALLPCVLFTCACNPGAEENTDLLVLLAGGAAVVVESTPQPLSLDGTGAYGALGTGNDIALYSFSLAQDSPSLTAVYANTVLDAVLTLSLSGVRTVYRNDRALAGVVERREASLGAGTYILQVSPFAVSTGIYFVAATTGAVSGGGSCVIDASRCRDYAPGTAENAARGNCGNAGGTFATNACSSTNRTGQCTTAFFDTGIVTDNGYSPTYLTGALLLTFCLSEYGADDFVFQ